MVFFQNHLGEFYALGTALFWTITALAFESASLKVGSITVNVIRLILGLLFLCIFTSISRGMILPLDASGKNLLWLGLSGLVGFVFGDLLLLKSFTIIGSRFAMLIMAMAPTLAAIFGWIILGERIGWLGLIGMVLTLGGISLAIVGREDKNARIKLKLSPKGVIYAFGGALGQGLGLVLSKLGMRGYDPFAATQIRVIAGIIGFSALISIIGRWTKVFEALTHVNAMKRIVIGSFFGPFLGVSFSLLAIARTEAGIASTIMSIVPVLLIPPAILFMKEKVTLIEIIGAIISVLGVAMFFIK
jgi:drug/metabolite transporter (DMT)-like permease